MAAEGLDFEGARVGLIEMAYAGMDGNRLAFNLLRTGDGAVWLADFGPPPSLEIPTVDAVGMAIVALLVAAYGGLALRRRAFRPAEQRAVS